MVAGRLATPAIGAIPTRLSNLTKRQYLSAGPTHSTPIPANNRVGRGHGIRVLAGFPGETRSEARLLNHSVFQVKWLSSTNGLRAWVVVAGVADSVTPPIWRAIRCRREVLGNPRPAAEAFPEAFLVARTYPALHIAPKERTHHGGSEKSAYSVPTA